MAAAFWQGPIRRRAWLLTLCAFGFEILNVGLQLALNYWNRSFFDALERRSSSELWSAVTYLPPLLVLAISMVAGAVVSKALLQVHWRSQVTDRLCDRWLDNHAFYRLNILRGADIAPEHRIAEDVRLAIDPIVDLVIGVTNALLTFLLFVGVLWTVGGSLRVGGVEIPGFMVFAAVGYAAIAASGMVWAGSTYAQRVRDRSEAEARFRFELTRIRENAESIAMSRGRRGEQVRLSDHFGEIVRRWTDVTWVWGRMTWVSHGNAVVSPIVPLLLMAPKYLSGEASLGTVMQAAAAFASVQAAAGWFTSNFARLSEWYASATRVAEIRTLMEEAGTGGDQQRIELGTSDDGSLHLMDVSVAINDGRVLVASADLVIRQGEMVMVVGASGSGKSSLIRAIAGLWPWGSGRILRPKQARVHFLPQRPYIPNGTLKAALAYPRVAWEFTDEVMIDALVSCGLKRLASRLNERAMWDKELSGGEQQRLAFARMLLDRPTIAILDEATSALDEPSQTELMELFRFRLASATVISIAHRPSLAVFHDRQIVLKRAPRGAYVIAHSLKPGPFNRMRAAWSTIDASRLKVKPKL